MAAEAGRLDGGRPRAADTVPYSFHEKAGMGQVSFVLSSLASFLDSDI